MAMSATAATSSEAAEHNCTCRANGQAFALGEITCIRGKLSQCQMNQNVTSWQTIADTCPEAKLISRPPVAALISVPVSSLPLLPPRASH
jgi:hypothetical protein